MNTASLAGLTTIPFMAPYSRDEARGARDLRGAVPNEATILGSGVKVSVLCPGFVKTRIADASRNWLEHLGPEPAHDDPESAVMEPLIRGLVEAGKPADELAEQVVDAIRAPPGSWCSPSRRCRGAPSTAALAALEGSDPTLPPLG